MRILITGCTYFPSRNGQSIFTINLAEGLASQGNSVLVVKPALDGLPKIYERNNVTIHEIKSYIMNWIHPETAMSFFTGHQVKKILDDFHPDVIHIHDHYPLSYTFVQEGKKRGIRVVGTNHFVPDNLAPYVPGSAHFATILSKIMWRWMLTTFNHLDFATAPSRTAAEILREQKIKLPVYPISCGVDIKRFKPEPTIDRGMWRSKYGLEINKPILLFVGRVDGEKKIDILIEAIRIRQKDDIQLAIAGGGSHRKHLEQLMRHYGIEKQVHFLGFVPNEDLPSIINSSDIFTMPSEAELLSIASLEAMACGKPLLLANARALPELVHDGINGYLFEAGSAEDAARKIDRLLERSADWHTMGMDSLHLVQSHTLENTIAGYSMLYYALVAGKNLPNPQTEWLKIRPGAAALNKYPSAN
jgi:1,2-diacylglycerol 3-alpha-glucosyltransferase